MSAPYPFLWFDGRAEEAAQFHASVFPRSKLGQVARHPEGSPGPAGSVMTVEFPAGQRFAALEAAAGARRPPRRAGPRSNSVKR